MACGERHPTYALPCYKREDHRGLHEVENNGLGVWGSLSRLYQDFEDYWQDADHYANEMEAARQAYEEAIRRFGWTPP